ncbi:MULTISPECIES: DUF4386 domain-containing protein [unclassified Roseateles]|uniref:DUF4386 domain-containing protein n=1 Tax=unclassified Roseateles TaxID=2626991 RepID=UPI0006FA4A53|nr:MULTISPECIES: DUF4386 domain-containing protein [unclassified Roseateles]KQW51639.1 hypothetical protein ASC81_03155 [Pelomonas sp. Root405]KRA77872.1 hypothetical protein ASD88_03155 [Pelomonas sp. Root662]
MSVVSPRELRLAGLCYLAIIALGLWAETHVRGSLVVPGDAAATAERIAANPQLWRLGLVADLLMQLLDLPVIVVLWRLLRPVNETLALTATFLNLVQTAVLVANRVQLLTTLDLLTSPAIAAAFLPGQREALAMLAVQLHGQGFGIGLIFFGFACVIRGWLIARSGLLPRALGWLLLVAGLAYLLNSFALLLAPAFAKLLFPAVMLPVLVGELAFALWMTAGKHRLAAAAAGPMSGATRLTPPP